MQMDDPGRNKFCSADSADITAIDELSLVVAPIVADAADKPLFMDSTMGTMEKYQLEDVQYRNGALWLNYKAR